jgi:hypothetical protein
MAYSLFARRVSRGLLAFTTYNTSTASRRYTRGLPQRSLLLNFLYGRPVYAVYNTVLMRIDNVSCTHAIAPSLSVEWNIYGAVEWYSIFLVEFVDVY